MVRVAVVGLGKMGLSHYAIVNAHPDVQVVAVCDGSTYITDVLEKYTGVRTFSDFGQMLAKVEMDAVIIATPSKAHASMVRTCLDKGIHVFCEKPFTLDAADARELTTLAEGRGLVNQVGYHYRFVGAFQEVKRLLDAKAIGDVTHVLAEAYGPVVLRPKGGTWRTKREEGGGCLYDYAAHPLNLLNWYFGLPTAVGGTVMHSIFSKDTDDEVYATLYFDGGLSAQLSVNWSDESHRKMSTKLTLLGTNGRIVADRQEVQVYLRDAASGPAGYGQGWTVRNTTELTEEVWFYIRGEEYSAQIDHFVRAVQGGRETINSFASAAQTDEVITMLIADASRELGTGTPVPSSTPKRKRFSIFG